VGNAKSDHKETGYKEVDYIHAAQDRVQWRTLGNTVIKLRVQYGGEFVE
jgi:hypothetical protein